MEILNALNNREKALIVWVLIAFIMMLTQSKIRQSLVKLLDAFMKWKIVASFVSMIIYIIVIVYWLARVGIWNPTLHKDTIFWFLGTGFVLLINISKALRDENFFRHIVRDSLTFLLVIEFVVNLYTFGLIVEIVLVPILFIASGVRVVADMNEETKSVKKLMDLILQFFALGVIVFTLQNIVTDFETFKTLDNLRAFLLFPLLTLFYIPFLYILALLMSYEQFFIVLSATLKDDKALVNAAKWETLIACNVNLRKVRKFRKEIVRRLLLSHGRESVSSIIQELEKDPANRQPLWRWIYFCLAIWNMLLYLKSS